jgi:outer membrane protein OmpA-like peptidoglycan-associated protein
MQGLKKRLFGLAAVLCCTALLGACGPSKQEVSLQDENKELRARQGDMEGRIAALETNVGSLSTQLQTIKTAPAPAPVMDESPARTRSSEAARPQGRRIDLGTTLFASGSDVLSANARKSIDNAVRNISKSSSILVEGYSDSTPITKSKWPSNEALAQARADSVRKYLASRGFTNVESVGYGAVSRNGRAPSRRVELVVD